MFYSLGIGENIISAIKSLILVKEKMKKGISKYQIKNNVHIFLVAGSFSKKSSLQAKDLVFLAEGIVHHFKEELDGNVYYIRINRIILNIVNNLFIEGQISRFASVWVERGEEAWKLWNTPSNRFAKVE